MSKYNASKVKIDGITFDSKREAARYQELKLLERAGEIKELRVHPKYRLLDGFDFNGEHYRPINYFADFAYKENGKYIIEDTKGVQTSVFRIKMKLLLNQLDDSLYEFRIVK